MAMSELLRETRPTARKPHRCEMCQGDISPGDIYRRDTLVGDGRVYDWVQCHHCDMDDITLVVWEWCDRPGEGVGRDESAEWALGHRHDPRARRFLTRGRQ